ncbi:hypothetical protein [uncultured Brevundimonas sp.]|uniref:hypothetical protein n=1 Tax=uncultured Brevundimonas sp. TaxID=213418 RepID=UPI0025FFC5BD|nr:hypothetical protein [uncultured Brevundimonas sp.]
MALFPKAFVASVVFAMSGIGSDASAEDALKALVTWDALEVVSDRPEVIERVDSILAGEGFTPGMRMSAADSRIGHYCTRLESVFGQGAVQCHPILQGGGTAILVVQFDEGFPARRSQEIPGCSVGAQLPSEAQDALSRWQDLVIQKLQVSGGDPMSLTEFVNNDHYLDYRDVGLHEAASALHKAVATEFDVIAVSSRACEPRVRSHAVAMLNYSGRPQDALNLAIARIADPDEEVRNESLRLTSTFSSYMTPDSRSEMVDVYCHLLRSPSFFDRNKSLAGLSAIFSENPSSVAKIDPSCLDLIRTAAVLSRSEQIGGYARDIVRTAVHSSRLSNP